MIAAIKLAHTKNPKPGSPSRYAMFDLEDTERHDPLHRLAGAVRPLRAAGPARRDRGRPRRRRQAARQRRSEPHRQRSHRRWKTCPARYTRGVLRIRVSENRATGSQKLDQVFYQRFSAVTRAVAAWNS